MKKSLFTLALIAAGFGAAAQTTAPAAPAAIVTGLPVAAPVGYTELLGATITSIMRTGDPAELRALAAKMERAATVAPPTGCLAITRRMRCSSACFKVRKTAT